jgi:hypothetical protein
MLCREAHIGQHVSLGFIHERGEFGHTRSGLIGHLAPLLGRGSGIVLREGGADPGGDDAALGLAGIGQGIAHEVHAATLPGGAEHLGDGGLEAFMGVGDYQLHATQTAPGEAAQELHPERLGLAVANCHAEHLPPAVGVDADGDDHRDGDDVVVAPHLQIGGIEPDIGPLAFDLPPQECIHPLVDLAAQARHLALADAVHAERLHQVIDRAGGDALDVGFLDDRSQRLLGHPARFQEAGEVAAMAQLGNAQLDGAGAGAPVSVAVAVTLVGALGAAFAWCGAAQRLGLQRHQAFGGKADHLAQERRVGALLEQRAKGDLVIGHRRGPRVRVAVRTSTLPGTAAVTTAVDKSPAYARLAAVATAGDLPTAPTPPHGTRPVCLQITRLSRR